MRTVALVFALVVSASTEEVVVDGEVAACAPVKDQALQAVNEQLGMASNAVVETRRARCKAMSKTDCDADKVCKYCDSNTTCWPLIDLSNPCDQGAINNILLAGDLAGDAGSAIGDAASAFAAKCTNQTSEADCPTLMCSWCGTSSSCHVYGSATNECLREHLKEMAKEQTQAAVDAAKAQASEEVQKIMEQCSVFNGNETGCGEHRGSLTGAEGVCTWCGSTHNICYFMGDKSNKCIRERIQKRIETWGAAKPITDWAGSSYTDFSEWSEELCGGAMHKHASSLLCTNDHKCTYCSDSHSCHAFGNPNNPCGIVVGVGNGCGANKFCHQWEDFFGNDGCAVDKVAAHKALKEVADAAKNNLQVTCTEYMKTKFFAQQSLASLGEDVQGVSDSAKEQVQESMSEMASVQIDQAKTALQDAIASSNASMRVSAALAYLEAASPCVVEMSAAGPRIASLASLVVSAFMVVIFG